MSGPVDEIRHRIDDLLYERPLTPARLVAGAAVLLVAAGLLLALWWPGGPADPARLPFVTVPPEPPGTVPAAPAEVVVHVAGAVARPGLYVRPDGDRVADAITAAGGVLDDARPDLLNLAAPLRDGTRIWVPSTDREVDPGIGLDDAGPPPVVDVNRADVDELQVLPGVGPSLAAAIVRHRDRMGAFATVEDLLLVPGIGPSTLAGFLDRVDL